MSDPTTGIIDNYGIRYNWGTLTLEMNTGDETWVPIPIDVSDQLALADGKIFIGNSGGAAAAVTPSGGFTISNTGVATLASTAVTSRLLTGFVSGAGTVAATDTILQGINKLNGNTVALTSTVAALPVVTVMAGDPMSPTEGQMWYDTGTHTWRGYNGTDKGTFTFVADA